MVTLGGGNQPCQWLPSSTITLKEHQWKYFPNTQYLPGSGFQPEWKGQDSKFASEAMEKICCDGKVKADGEQGCLVSSWQAIIICQLPSSHYDPIICGLQSSH